MFLNTDQLSQCGQGLAVRTAMSRPRPLAKNELESAALLIDLKRKNLHTAKMISSDFQRVESSLQQAAKSDSVAQSPQVEDQKLV